MNRLSWITNTNRASNRVGFSLSLPSSITDPVASAIESGKGAIESGKGTVSSLKDVVSEPGKKVEAVKSAITTVKTDYTAAKKTASETMTGAYVAVGVAALVGVYLLATRKP